MPKYTVEKLHHLYAVAEHDWNDVVGDHYVIIKRGFKTEADAQIYADTLNAKFLAKGAV